MPAPRLPVPSRMRQLRKAAAEGVQGLALNLRKLNAPGAEAAPP